MTDGRENPADLSTKAREMRRKYNVIMAKPSDVEFSGEDIHGLCRLVENALDLLDQLTERAEQERAKFVVTPEFLEEAGLEPKAVADAARQKLLAYSESVNALWERAEKAEQELWPLRNQIESLSAAFEGATNDYFRAVKRAEKAERERDACEEQFIAKVDDVVTEMNRVDEVATRLLAAEALLDEIGAWATKTEHQGFASDYDRGFVLAQTEVAAILSKRENQKREGGTDVSE